MADLKTQAAGVACSSDMAGKPQGLRDRGDAEYDLKSAKAMGLKKASKLFSPVRDAHRAPVYRRTI